MSTQRAMKLNDNDILKFLDLFKKEFVLHNPTLEYRDRKMRAVAAAQRISKTLNIDGFGTKEAILELRNLISSYFQEVEKIEDSQRSGKSTDEVYKPKVVWFTKMNSFIRPFVQQRETQSDMVLQENDTQTEFNQEIDAEKVEVIKDTTHDEIVSHTPQLSKASSAYKSVEKRKMSPKISESENVLSKKRKNMNVCKESDISHLYPIFISHAINKLQDISTRAEQIAKKKEDNYDHFGTYIASLLRTVGFPDAMKLQQQITTLITDKMYALTTQDNNQSVRSTSSEGGTFEHIYSPSFDEEYS